MIVLILLIFYFCAEQKARVIYLNLKYISDMPPITLKRQHEEVHVNDGTYIVLSEKSYFQINLIARNT